MLLKVDCLPNAVGKQPSIPLIYLGRKWTLNWWWWWWWWWWWCKKKAFLKQRFPSFTVAANYCRNIINGIFVSAINTQWTAFQGWPNMFSCNTGGLVNFFVSSALDIHPITINFFVSSALDIHPISINFFVGSALDIHPITINFFVGSALDTHPITIM